jgi:hypothetical protein
MLGKIKVVLAIIVIFGSFAFAQEAEQAVGSSGSASSTPTQSQGLMPVQTNTVDFGMPQQSFASPEYVAQEKMLESMTTAYNWISLNSSRFAQGCKEDRPALVSEISNVLSRAQETSTVCSTFASEAKSCNPETFCSRFKQGNLPLPANAKAVLKKLGYDPDLLKVEDLTVDLISKVCMDQRKSGNEEQTSMLESVKQKIQDQLPEFRKKCELLKQARGRVPEVMLPNIDIRPQAQQNYVAGPSNMPQGSGGGQACAEPHPDCYPLPSPQCRNGTWVCEGIAQQPMQGQMPQNQPQPMQQTTDSSGNIICPGQAPNCAPGPAPMCQNGSWICPQAQPQPVEQPPTQPQPQPAPSEPAPAPLPSTPAPAPAPAEPVPATGAVTMGSAVCGNTLCEPGLGENNSNCPQDCMPNAGSNQPMPSNPQAQQPYAGQPQGNQQAQVNNFVMPGPEQLCEMTDAEIIGVYTAQMSGGAPSTEEMQYQCSQEAQRELNSMGRYKLEAAKCKADAALDCEAKKQALSSCNEMKSNPEKIAGIIVDSMCRRFGVNAVGDSESQLYEVASKWVNSDPALANQLGDTADQASNAKSKLDVISYIFGNGDYAGNLDKKASDLRAIRQRLVSSGVNDSETLNALDSQAKEFEAESKQFENLLDFSRLGYLFK